MTDDRQQLIQCLTEDLDENAPGSLRHQLDRWLDSASCRLHDHLDDGEAATDSLQLAVFDIGHAREALEFIEQRVRRVTDPIVESDFRRHLAEATAHHAAGTAEDVQD